MRVHLEQFTSNNPSLLFDDVIQNLRMGRTASGVVNLYFETRDKYIQVDAVGAAFTWDYAGNTIYLCPHIYDGERYLEDDEFYEHPNFWCANLIVDMNHTDYSAVVIPLKYGYFVSYVPYDDVMNHDCLKEVEVIEHT